MSSKLAIGCAQFGLDYGVSNKQGQTTFEDVKKIVDLAKIFGIDTFDTAPAYGESESVLGQVSSVDARIITKTIHIADDVIGKPQIGILQKAFQQSLNKLGKTQLYGLLVHSANDLLKPGGDKIYSWLRENKDSGVIKKIGVSIYSAEQADRIMKQYPIDIIQLPLNILDQRLSQSGHIFRLKEAGVEIHLRSVFLQGLLLMGLDQVPGYFKPYHNVLAKFHEEARRRSLSTLELALGFCMNMPNIDKLVIGVNSLSQFKEIVNASKVNVEINELSYLACDELGLLNPSLWKN
jgi:aryl-alcohol dehydrogenase-like predicted oxidoreductase